MSNENYNIDYESLEFFNTEIPNEDYYGETEIHEYDHYVYNDISSISSFNIEKEVEDEYSFIYDESELDKLLNLTNKIKRVESLRMELALMNHRKSIVMNILPKFFENGLCESEVPTIKGTTEEVKEYYNNLLLEFKNKKEAWINRERLLKDEINEVNENFNLKQKAYSEIVDNQYKSELKMAADMENKENKKTGKSLFLNEVMKLLDNCKLQNYKVNESRLNYIIEINKCKKLKTDVENVNTNLSYIIEYKEVKYKTEELGLSLDEVRKSISMNRDIIIKTQKNISKLSEGMNNLAIIKKNKKAELKKLKDQWRKNVIAKLHNQKILKRQRKAALNRTDDFSENPLLLKDYYDCVETAQATRMFEDLLSQKLANNKVKISHLKAKYENKENKMNRIKKNRE